MAPSLADPPLLHPAPQFDIPATYPTTAPEIELPELEGKTAKMYRGGKICLTVGAAAHAVLCCRLYMLAAGVRGRCVISRPVSVAGQTRL